MRREARGNHQLESRGKHYHGLVERNLLLFTQSQLNKKYSYSCSPSAPDRGDQRGPAAGDGVQLLLAAPGRPRGHGRVQPPGHRLRLQRHSGDNIHGHLELKHFHFGINDNRWMDVKVSIKVIL